MFTHKKSTKGFTLIELMIVVAIIGILVGIAFPSYTKYVLRGKRAEGRIHLTDAAARLERHYSDNNKYVDGTTADVLISTITATSENSYYTLTIDVNSPFQTYTLTATPILPMVDPECGNLTLTQAGVRATTSGTVKACWAK